MEVEEEEEQEEEHSRGFFVRPYTLNPA